MRSKRPLFAAAGVLALGLGASGANAQDAATATQLEAEFRCEEYLAAGDIEALAAIAADELDPRREFAELCLARFVQPALGITEVNDSDGPNDGNYGG
jgi:hypothetical protein